MKTIIFFLLTVTSLSAQQPSWQWRNPLPGRTSICHVNVQGSVFWVVGKGGLLMSSHNSGLTWQIRPSFTTLSLFDIHFVTAKRGWIAGDSGVILTSYNSGSSWSRQMSTVNTPLNSIHFIDENFGWACGQQGIVLRTTNGGKVWEKQLVPNNCVNNNFTSLDFVDGAYGWMVGADGIILATTDSGNIWAQQRSQPGDTLRAVDFADRNNGFIVGSEGNAGVILHTTDGGSIWTLKDTLVAATLADVTMLNSFVAYAVGSDSTILMTTDSGKTWSRQLSGVSSSSFNSVRFTEAQTGVCIGTNGTIYITSNGGSSWKLRRTDISSGRGMFSMFFIDSLCGWICGGIPGYVLRTTDGGLSWSEHDPPIPAKEPWSLYAIHFTSRLVGWVGGDYVLFKTNDGGITWLEVKIPVISNLPYNDYRHIDFLSDEIGWITFTYGVASPLGEDWTWRSGLLKTTDGGSTWVKQAVSDTSTSIISYWSAICMADEQTGWVAEIGFGSFRFSHKSTALYRTTDGVTWLPVAAMDMGGYRDVFFLDKKIGWVVGDNGLIMKSTDGGSTWTTQHPPSATVHFQIVRFVTDQVGWTCGNNPWSNLAVILFTSDGGLTWSEQPCPKGDYVLHSIFPFTKDKAFVVGAEEWGWDQGIFFETTNGGKPFMEKKIGEMEVSPVMVNYGSRKINTNQDTLVQVRNIGNGLLNVSSTAFSNSSMYSIYSGGALFSLDPGENHNVKVRYRPLSQGDHRDSLVVKSDGIVPTGSILFLGRGGDSVSSNVFDYDVNNSHHQVSAYPNPFSELTTIQLSLTAGNSLRVFDVFGREVFYEKFLQPADRVKFNGSFLTPGVYMYSVNGGNQIFSGKFVILK